MENNEKEMHITGHFGKMHKPKKEAALKKEQIGRKSFQINPFLKL